MCVCVCVCVSVCVCVCMCVCVVRCDRRITSSRYGSETLTEEPMVMEFMRLSEERKNPPTELQSRSCD